MTAHLKAWQKVLDDATTGTSGTQVGQGGCAQGRARGARTGQGRKGKAHQVEVMSESSGEEFDLVDTLPPSPQPYQQQLHPCQIGKETIPAEIPAAASDTNLPLPLDSSDNDRDEYEIGDVSIAEILIQELRDDGYSDSSGELVDTVPVLNDGRENIEENSGDDTEEGEIGVEKIEKHCLFKGRLQFRVWWEDGDRTWEPFETVDELEALDNYLKRKGVKAVDELR